LFEFHPEKAGYSEEQTPERPFNFYFVASAADDLGLQIEA